MQYYEDRTTSFHCTIYTNMARVTHTADNKKETDKPKRTYCNRASVRPSIQGQDIISLLSFFELPPVFGCLVEKPMPCNIIKYCLRLHLYENMKHMM